MGNGRIIFRVVAGGYLAYLGITLLMDSIKEKPDNYMWYMLVGTVFTLLGGFLLIWTIVSHFRGDKEASVEEKNETEIEANDSEENVIEEKETEEAQESGIVDKEE